MGWQISSDDRAYLRELARKQAEYAALPVMSRRKKMWYDLNDGRRPACPPVVVETGTFNCDFLPDSMLRCQSQPAKDIERQLRQNIRNHELIDDDKVMPDSFQMKWFVDIDRFGGVKIQTERLTQPGGLQAGYRYLHPIKNLKEDFHLLRPAQCRVDREKTLAYKAFLDELFDRVLPVRLQSGFVDHTVLTYHVIELMGMEAFFTAMYDCPDQVHRLMAYLRDNALRIMRWSEDNQLLRVNNGNEMSFYSSFNFTTALPAPGYQEPVARLCDMWGATSSQETVGVSPAMFHEFCFPYYRDICEPMGLVYYGCCEPVHPYWDDIRQMPHLKKVSISRWCDQAFMGEALRETSIVFSRKPDPRFIGVDVNLDEEAWRADVRATLEATHGVFVEFIYRDVYTVHGNLDKPRRAVEIAREEIDRHYRP